MKHQTYRQARAGVALIIGTVVASATVQHSYLLAISGVMTGLLFLLLVRAKTKITTDERETAVKEKAAQLTYAIFAPTIAIGALVLLIPSYSGLEVFAKGEFSYLESLGMVFAYLSLFLMAIYAISYHFLDKKYGGGNEK